MRVCDGQKGENQFSFSQSLAQQCLKENFIFRCAIQEQKILDRERVRGKSVSQIHFNFPSFPNFVIDSYALRYDAVEGKLLGNMCVGLKKIKLFNENFMEI